MIDLLTLPLAQRLELVRALWDSIAIDQRLERFLAAGDPGLDADDVLGA